MKKLMKIIKSIILLNVIEIDTSDGLSRRELCPVNKGTIQTKIHRSIRKRDS